MDHLPKLRDGIPYPKAEYVCIESYDGFSFEGYPSRCGIDVDRLIRGDFSQQSSRQIASFLQNWLFFGVLYEIFSNHHFWPWTQDTWVLQDEEGMRWVKTDELCGDWFQEWYFWVNEQTREQVVLISKRTQLCLERLHVFSETLGESQMCPLPQSVVLSLKILGATLMLATARYLPFEFIYPQRFWGLGPEARRLLICRGWCIRDITMAEKFFGEATMFYVAHLRREQTNQDHSKCLETLCLANQVDETSYQTKHRTLGCSCRNLRPDVAEIRKIIAKREVPVIELSVSIASDGSRSLQIRMKSYRYFQHFIAISHVWSDGLGNPHDNALPECQLLWLYDNLADARSSEFFREWERGWTEVDWNTPIVSGATSKLETGVNWLRHARGKRVCLWIDTLCVPLDTIHRALAIKSMKTVYSAALFTVVLDAELQQLHGDSAAPEEVLIRVLVSSWMRRAWTFQEAVFANTKLRIKVNGKLVNLARLLEQGTQRQVGTEQHLMAPSMVGFFQKYTTWIADKKLPSDEYHKEKAHHKRFHFSLASVAFEEAKSAFEDMSRLWFLPTEINNEERVGRIRAAWECLRWRATSREEDKIIIFAFACIMNAKDLATAQNLSNLPPQQRMKHWISQQELLPHDLIFVEGEKIKDEGFRWAPSSVHAYPIPDVYDDEGDEVEIGTGNLILRQRGYTFNEAAFMKTSPLRFSDPNSQREFSINLVSKSIDQQILQELDYLVLIIVGVNFLNVSGVNQGILGALSGQEGESAHIHFISLVEVQVVGEDAQTGSTRKLYTPDFTPHLTWYIG